MMKPNSTSTFPTRKEVMSTGDQAACRQLPEYLIKVLENNKQVISDNNKVTQNSLALAGTDETVVAMIEKLLATNMTLAATNEKILRVDYSEMEFGSELQPFESDIPPPKDWENHYSALRDEGRKDPVKVLSRFVQIETLFEQRESLFLLYSAAIQSEMFEDADAETQSNRFFFYSTLIQLMEGVYRLVELIEKNQLTFSYVSNLQSS